MRFLPVGTESELSALKQYIVTARSASRVKVENRTAVVKAIGVHKQIHSGDNCVHALCFDTL